MHGSRIANMPQQIKNPIKFNVLITVLVISTKVKMDYSSASVILVQG
jgi:hypothetical protein